MKEEFTANVAYLKPALATLQKASNGRSVCSVTKKASDLGLNKDNLTRIGFEATTSD